MEAISGTCAQRKNPAFKGFAKPSLAAGIKITRLVFLPICCDQEVPGGGVATGSFAVTVVHRRPDFLTPAIEAGG